MIIFHCEVTELGVATCKSVMIPQPCQGLLNLSRTGEPPQVFTRKEDDDIRSLLPAANEGRLQNCVSIQVKVWLFRVGTFPIAQDGGLIGLPLSVNKHSSLMRLNWRSASLRGTCYQGSCSSRSREPLTDRAVAGLFDRVTYVKGS